MRNKCATIYEQFKNAQQSFWYININFVAGKLKVVYKLIIGFCYLSVDISVIGRYCLNQYFYSLHGNSRIFKQASIRIWHFAWNLPELLNMNFGINGEIFYLSKCWNNQGQHTCIGLLSQGLECRRLTEESLVRKISSWCIFNT